MADARLRDPAVEEAIDAQRLAKLELVADQFGPLREDEAEQRVTDNLEFLHDFARRESAQRSE